MLTILDCFSNMFHVLLNKRPIICMLQKSDGVAGALQIDGNQCSASGSPSSSSKCAHTKSTRRENAASNKSFPERTVAGDPSPVREYFSTMFLLLLFTLEKIVMSQCMTFPRFASCHSVAFFTDITSKMTYDRLELLLRIKWIFFTSKQKY